MARRFKFKRPLEEGQKRMLRQVLDLLLGMNNTEAANAVGVTNGTVSKWRTRRTHCPSMTSALKVAAAMGCQIEIVQVDEAKAEKRERRAEHRASLH